MPLDDCKSWANKPINPGNEMIKDCRFRLMGVLDINEDPKRTFQNLGNRIHLVGFCGEQTELEVLEVLRKENKSFDLFSEEIWLGFYLISEGLNKNTKISLNVYSDTLLNPNFMGTIEKLERRFPILKSSLTFNIVDLGSPDLGPDLDEIFIVLEKLTASGYKISLENFFLFPDRLAYWPHILDLILKRNIQISEIRIKSSFLKLMYNHPKVYKLYKDFISSARERGIVRDFICDGLPQIEIPIAKDLGFNLYI